MIVNAFFFNGENVRVRKVARLQKIQAATFATLASSTFANVEKVFGQRWITNLTIKELSGCF